MNDSPYGLQAGVFTSSIDRALLAHRDLEVGGVIVERHQRVPRRPDALRRARRSSGYGREGLRWAMDEMTEPRIMVLSHVPL